MPAARYLPSGGRLLRLAAVQCPPACLLQLPVMLLHSQHASAGSQAHALFRVCCSRSCASKRALCVGRASKVSLTLIWPHNGYPGTEWCVSAAATARARCIVCLWPCATCVAFSISAHFLHAVVCWPLLCFLFWGAGWPPGLTCCLWFCDVGDACMGYACMGDGRVQLMSLSLCLWGSKLCLGLEAAARVLQQALYVWWLVRHQVCAAAPGMALPAYARRIWFCCMHQCPYPDRWARTLLMLLLPRHCPACLGYLVHVHEHEVKVVAAFSLLELCMRPACGVSIPCSS